MSGGQGAEPEPRERMRQAVRRAVTRDGRVRRASGVSLMAVLCASALAPLVAAGTTLGPVALAAAGVAGGVGAEVLGELVNGVLDSLRRDETHPTEESVEHALAERLESALSVTDASGAALRETTADLLHALDAVQVVVEHLASTDGQALNAVTEDLADLGGRFTEFGFVADDIGRAVQGIEASLREQRAEYRVLGERSREHSLELSRVLDELRRPRYSSSGDAGRSAWPDCPYLGLVPFSQREARLFYGRRELTRRLRQALADRLADPRLLLVTGPSGSGKSSLLRAGLVPALTQDTLGSVRWPCRVLTPTGSPLRALAAHLADLSGQGPGTVFATLSLHPERAADLAAESLRSVNLAGGVAAPRLVLIVDQFEELFTLTARDEAGRAERTAFVKALHAAATVPVGVHEEPAAVVVAAIRGDFLDQSLAYPVLADAQKAGPFLVGPMTEAELREAVTGPAAEAGLAIDAELVDELAREARDRSDAIELGSGVLPLVSQVMAATWEKREDDRLTLLAYRRAGGLAGAVNQSAHEVYDSLDEQRRGIAKAVFLRLTLVTHDGKPVRRRCTRAELYAAGAEADVDAVVGAFAARRLLVLERDTVEIAHDVLLRTWAELAGWLDGDRVGAALYAQVITDAEAWEHHGHDPSYLYRPGRLTQIREAMLGWARDPDRYPMPPAAERFLAAGRAAARRAIALRRATMIGMSLLTVAAVVAAVVAVNNEHTAQARQAIILSRQLAAQSLTEDQTDPLLARQLAAAAWTASPTTQANSAMTALLNEQQRDSMLIGTSGQVDAVTFSPGGELVADAGADGLIRLWNTHTGSPAGRPIPCARVSTADGTPSATAVAFSPDGGLLACAATDGTVRVWSTATGAQRAKMDAAGPSDSILGTNAALIFSRDGKALFGNVSGAIRLWSTGTGKQLDTPPDGVINGKATDVYSLALSPDGTMLAAGTGDGRILLWNTTTWRRTGTLLSKPPKSFLVSSVAFSPDGKTLAGTASSGQIQLWNPVTGKKTGSPLTATEYIRSVFPNSISAAFNRDGTLLATSETDGTIRLWNTTTRRQTGNPITVEPPSNKVTLYSRSPSTFGPASSGVVIAFSPDGRTLATGGRDGTVRLWDAASQEPIGSTMTVGGGYQADTVAISPNGKILAAGGGDGNAGGVVQLWNPASREPIGTQVGTSDFGSLLSGPVISLAFSPDGRILATLSESEVQFWDSGTGRSLGELPVSAVELSAGQLFDAAGLANLMAFSPDGRMLAIPYQNGSSHNAAVQLWNPRTHARIGSPFDIGGTLNSDGSFDFGTADGVAFSPDGERLAAFSGATARVWNLATRRRVGRPMTAPGDGDITALAFSPDGKTLITGDDHDDIQRWNVATGTPDGPARTTAGNGSPRNPITATAFSPNGRFLASADDNGTIGLWNPATGQVLGAMSVGDSEATAVAFSPDGDLLAGTDSSGAVRLWNVAWFADPYGTLCSETAPLTRRQWSTDVPNEPQPAACR